MSVQFSSVAPFFVRLKRRIKILCKPLIVVVFGSSSGGGGGKGRKLKSPLSETTSPTAGTVRGESILRLMMQSGPRPIVSILIAWTAAARRHLSTVLRRLMQEAFQVVGLKLYVTLAAVRAALDSDVLVCETCLPVSFLVFC